MTPQNQAKEAWKELEERFSVAKVTNSATTEVRTLLRQNGVSSYVLFIIRLLGGVPGWTHLPEATILTIPRTKDPLPLLSTRTWSRD